MGNAPGKLGDGTSGPGETGNYRTSSGRSMSASSAGTGNRIPPWNAEYNVRSRRGASLVGNILSTSGRSRADSVGGSQPSKRKSTKEREQAKETHAKQLVVKFDETVDGGFLAPYGCYGFEKLDYDADVVRSLIIDRKLAPFYTPLQDFDESWTKEELIKIVDGLPLHASFDENLEKYEDVAVGNLKKTNFDELIDKTLSKREQRRMRSKIFKARLYRKRIIWQEIENENFLEQKLESKKPNSTSKNNSFLASDDLKYSLYKNGAECPICFLYYPEPLNYSNCCLQPICTECFVQIKRAEPHFPHDEVDPTQPVTNDDEKDPNLLTSDPPNCAYCATPNFAVTYEAKADRRVGIGGMKPSTYKLPKEPSNNDIEPSAERRGSRTQNNADVVASDMIRPDWKAKLDKERARLARRSANATAIHVSNRLIDPDHPSRRGSNYDSSSNRDVQDLEEEMLARAIRLSIADEEVRNQKKSNSR
ncbi:Sip5p TDEL_0G03190 [Torulaspora delbrueckii]|uniref:Protein SIP5 n=1 Tax=Torulaspora delbrueckii TaxID=4950 RepID=G8ZXR9_TORDE|nr:hypothetical protein TDEL_0G03190 [Torulaspora delbrueckii]CCE93686.1 hypothetical protein TDEL_0G03190 [Torulaspora delbrueckii]